MELLKKIFSKIYWFFSLYTDADEREIAQFFLGDAQQAASRNLLVARLRELMQKDLIRMNLYQEWKFKGYKNLRKSARKNLYADVKKMKATFTSFCAENMQNIVVDKALKTTRFSEDKQKYLACIMHFLSPHTNYVYQESAAFSRLLCDPNVQKMVGDCNQICTLYLALYALKFPVTDFQIRTPKGHVCLHWGGVDIECTNATATHYDQGEIRPVEEIVTTNMLDVNEKWSQTHGIPAKDYIMAAKFVQAISSNREIAERNLRVAYHNLAVEDLKNHNFDQAAQYFDLAGETKAKSSVWGNAVQYYLDQKSFGRALKYANKSTDETLKKMVVQREGSELLKRKKYQAAISRFHSIYDNDAVKNVRFQWLHDLNQTLANCKTVADYKPKTATLKKMRDLAIKVGNEGVKKFCDDVLKQI